MIRPRHPHTHAKSLRAFWADERGAVAASYALALPVLVAAAAFGMDYARMVGMDSELQNGADQAALAAASQLNKNAGACARAANAAVSLVANQSLLGSGDNAVTIPLEEDCDAVGQIRFYQDKAKIDAATTDANARFVEVRVNAKTVDYALFPVIGLVTSGNMDAAAFAGLGSAICKVPPVMMCNPNETSDPEFNTANYAGYGIRLVANVNGKNGNNETADETPGSYGPGVFGYLETDAGSGANATAQSLGRLQPPGECVSVEGADVKPGQQVSVLDALNTRFGVFDNGLNNACGTDNALCPPSDNARIDLLKKAGNGGSCRIHSSGFQVGENPYRPTSGVNNINPAGLDPMGYPRDKCHAVSVDGICSGNGNARVGNGDWDRAAYYATNGYGSVPTTWSSYGYPELKNRTTPTRYQQYRYEYDNKATMLAAKNVGSLQQQGTPLCTPPAGIAPASTPDRRVLSVAVINCNAEDLSSSTTDAEIKKFVDVFLVEPTARRTHDGTQYTRNSDVYIEVIGETTLGGGATQGQKIRKDVPYLIE